MDPDKSVAGSNTAYQLVVNAMAGFQFHKILTPIDDATLKKMIEIVEKCLKSKDSPEQSSLDINAPIMEEAMAYLQAHYPIILVELVAIIEKWQLSTLDVYFALQSAHILRTTGIFNDLLE